MILLDICNKKSIFNKKSNEKRAEDLYRSLSKDIHMDNKYMKRPSTSLIIREILIQIKMRYHLIPIRMDIIKETTNNKQ